MKCTQQGLLNCVNGQAKGDLISLRVIGFGLHVCSDEDRTMETAGTMTNTEWACAESLLSRKYMSTLWYVAFILPCEVSAGGISRSYCLRAAEYIVSRDLNISSVISDLGHENVFAPSRVTQSFEPTHCSQPEFHRIPSWADPQFLSLQTPPTLQSPTTLSNKCLTWFGTQSWVWAMEFQSCACKSGI